MIIREYTEKDIEDLIRIWNEVVTEGNAFPQEECLDTETGKAFFSSQSYTGVAENNGAIIGLYVLHPNNVGRCSQICNASYAVSSEARGQHICRRIIASDSIADFQWNKFPAVTFFNFAKKCWSIQNTE